jgi:hypothetical protein
MLMAFRTMGRRGGQRLHAGVHAPEAVFQLPCRSQDTLGHGAMDRNLQMWKMKSCQVIPVVALREITLW